MKKIITKSALSLFAATMILGPLGNMASAQSVDSNINPVVTSGSEPIKFTKIPDAFNQELENEKLRHVTGLNKGVTAVGEGNRIYLDPETPLVLTFEDGSTVTYSVKKVEAPTSSVQASTMNFTLDKSYTYMVGLATISPWVRNTTVSTNVDNGTMIKVSGKSSDYYQDVDTSLATVDPGENIVTQKYFDLYNSGFESENRGRITFDIYGMPKQQSYTLKWGVNPLRANKFVPYIISS